jgi:hypothetical protein
MSTVKNSNDLELSDETPLLLSVTPEEDKISKVKPGRSHLIIAITILLGITLVFVISLGKFSTLNLRTLALADKSADCDIEKGGVSYCPGKLPGGVQNFHLKPGCVMMSVNDLKTQDKNPSYKYSKILTICASMESGVVMVDNEKLIKYGMATDKQSYISSVLFSDDTQIKLFSGKTFDGSVTGSNGTPYKDPYTKILGLSGQRYTSEPFATVNDNVNSVVFATSSLELNSCLDALVYI